MNHGYVDLNLCIVFSLPPLDLFCGIFSRQMLLRTSLASRLCLFRLALWGYSVASLFRALRFTLTFSADSLPQLRALHSHSRSLRSLGLCASRLIRSLETRSSLMNIFEKKCVSIDSKCSETHRNAKKKIPL